MAVSVVAAQDQDLLSPCSGSSYTEQSRRWTASRQGAWLFAARPPEGVHAGQSAKPAAIAWTQALGGASSRYRGRPRPLRGHCWHPSGSGVISSVRRQPAMALPGRKHIGRAAKDLLEAQVMAAYDVQYGANNPGIGDGGENSPFSGTPQQDVRNELQNMLERFEGDMNKVLYAKRKRFKMNTDASVNTMQERVTTISVPKYLSIGALQSSDDSPLTKQVSPRDNELWLADDVPLNLLTLPFISSCQPH
nr:uncharacterized protein LOC109730290 [Microcebus murinus]